MTTLTGKFALWRLVLGRPWLLFTLFLSLFSLGAVVQQLTGWQPPSGLGELFNIYRWLSSFLFGWWTDIFAFDLPQAVKDAGLAYFVIGSAAWRAQIAFWETIRTLQTQAAASGGEAMRFNGMLVRLLGAKGLNAVEDKKAHKTYKKTMRGRLVSLVTIAIWPVFMIGDGLGLEVQHSDGSKFAVTFGQVLRRQAIAVIGIAIVLFTVLPLL